MKKNININAFIVVGALGVGKSTVCKDLHHTNRYDYNEKRRFRHIDLDGHIAKLKKMEVKEYFGTVGYEKFYEESYKIIKRLYNNHVKSGSKTILLIDVGSGSTFDYKSIALTREFQSILLTADPEYLFKREKCIKSHKELGYYKFWQFGKEKEQLFNQCDIKIDVSYLKIEEVAEIISKKVFAFKLSR